MLDSRSAATVADLTRETGKPLLLLPPGELVPETSFQGTTTGTDGKRWGKRETGSRGEEWDNTC